MIPAAEEADAVAPAAEEPAEVPAAEEAAAEEAAEEVKEEAGSKEEKAVEPKAEKPEEEDGEQVPEVTVTVTTVITGENEMKLIALVNDPENRAYTYQWQVSDNQGASYSDIADETSDVLRIELSEENRNNFWRVKVKRK